MNVYQKINEVKKVINVFKKDAETKGYGSYSYVSGSQILESIKAKMEEIGLLFIPVKTEHRDWMTYNYKNAKGEEKTDFVVDGKLIYEWINIDEPTDRLTVSFEYYGQQNDISKAFGSGLTYSERYLLLKSLGCPTDEDEPDAKNEDKPKYKSETTKPKTTQSKFNIINNMIKDTEITLNDVADWIAKKFGRSIKINDLTDEQFKSLADALSRKMGDQNE